MSYQSDILYFFLSRIPDYRLGCYYCLFQQKLLPETATMDSEHNPSEYVVCFLGGSEKGLELYPFFGLWGYQEGSCGKESWVLLRTSKKLSYLLCIYLNFIPLYNQFVLACFSLCYLQDFIYLIERENTILIHPLLLP